MPVYMYPLLQARKTDTRTNCHAKNEQCHMTSSTVGGHLTELWNLTWLIANGIIIQLHDLELLFFLRLSMTPVRDNLLTKTLCCPVKSFHLQC